MFVPSSESKAAFQSVVKVTCACWFSAAQTLGSSPDLEHRVCCHFEETRAERKGQCSLQKEEEWLAVTSVRV